MEITENNKGIAPDTEAELERLKEELRREHEMCLRALADFDNYRRRIDRERSATAQRAKRDNSGLPERRRSAENTFVVAGDLRDGFLLERP